MTAVHFFILSRRILGYVNGRWFARERLNWVSANQGATAEARPLAPGFHYLAAWQISKRIGKWGLWRWRLLATLFCVLYAQVGVPRRHSWWPSVVARKASDWKENVGEIKTSLFPYFSKPKTPCPFKASFHERTKGRLPVTVCWIISVLPQSSMRHNSVYCSYRSMWAPATTGIQPVVTPTQCLSLKEKVCSLVVIKIQPQI